MAAKNIPEIVEFNRPQKYRTVRVLGRGACGETLHIRDDAMDIDLVSKKYKPIVSREGDPELFAELLGRFRQEAKILFRINHPNIVRVFNFFDYHEYGTAYIIMEYVSGKNLLEYTKERPELLDIVFEKAIGAFAHLQGANIMHRDIRPDNILVHGDGDVKVIDSGFGKSGHPVAGEEEKSISLNWWCSPLPGEFADNRYDFTTEVYFVGKLFESAISESHISGFKYDSVISKMCSQNPTMRWASFHDIQTHILTGGFSDVEFSEYEIEVYREFSNSLASVFSAVGADADYFDDQDELIVRLEALYRATMLESYLPSVVKICRAFVIGNFRYYTNTKFEISILKSFLELIKSVDGQKRAIIFANIQQKLDGIRRIEPALEDEIPF